MLIDIAYNQQILFAALFEASQDEEWVLLSENPQGLISLGQAVCYAIIVKSGNQVALAHVSDLSERDIEFLRDMIDAVSMNNNEMPSVFLARSFNGYTEAREFDMAFCSEYEGEDADTYFNQKDVEYCTLFKDAFNIEPQYITMPHDFLVVDSQGAIHLFEEHEKDTLEFYERRQKNEVLEKPVMASPQLFFKAAEETQNESEQFQATPH